MSHKDQIDAEHIQTQLVTTASLISPSLAVAIERVPAIALQAQQDMPLADRLCRAVTGQQLSVKSASAIWQRLRASVPSGQPMSAYIVGATDDELRSHGLSRAKVRSVRAIAQTDVAGQLDAADFQVLNIEERTERLTQLWGVGQWTVNMINIFYFGEPDIWPDGDLAARKQLEQLTSARSKTIRTAEKFAPYRSYLALYMWRNVMPERFKPGARSSD